VVAAWSQIDWDKKILTVGRSKTEAGAGRTIPLNGTQLAALVDHLRWYVNQFGEVKPEWFVFPGGSRFPKDPARPTGSLKTAWNNVRKKAGVTGRWHDNRHTLITELAGRLQATYRGRCSRATRIFAPRRSGKRWRMSKRAVAQERIKEASHKRAATEARIAAG
jgi:integrase